MKFVTKIFCNGLEITELIQTGSATVYCALINSVVSNFRRGMIEL